MSMTVHRLKKALAHLPEDMEVTIDIRTDTGATKMHVNIDRVLYVGDKEIQLIGVF